MKKHLWLLITLLITLSLVVTACGGGPAEEAAPEEDTATEEAAPEEDATGEEAASEEEQADEADTGEEEAGAESLAEDVDTYLDRAYEGEFDGTVVTAFGPITDEDVVKFNSTIASFEEETGIDIQYEGSKEFETTISVRVDGGDPPDIADFPQPGLLANFARNGKIVDVNTFISMAALQENYNQSWLDMASLPGSDGTPIMAGVWQRVNGKSLVWYPKEEFDAAGYEIPETWDELMELTELIASDGDAPWCIGIESGTATGWPATDWLEEIMLRTTSLENYDRWTRGELPFNSPEVKNAAETMAEIWLNDDYVFGGRTSIVTTFFGDAPLPMFEEPPKCWLHKQGNFITTFFPTGAEAGTDYDFFYLPPIDEEYGKPVLVAGDIWAMFNDRPEVRAVIEYFSKGEHLRGWMEAGGAISPHYDSNLEWYSNDVDRGVAQIILEADSVRFDGSDLMPGEVGAGSFWKGMTDWISGSTDLDTALTEIQDAWPEQASVPEPAGEEPMADEEEAEEAEPPAEEADIGEAAEPVGIEPLEISEDSFLGQAYAGEFDGTTVSMFGPFTDEDAVKFNSSIEAFEEETGIDIQYEGSKEFETTISVRVDGGDPPDIADFPQPGLLANFARNDEVVDVTTFLDMDRLQTNYNQSWLDMATMEGPDGPMMAGVWHRVNAKSLVWYPKTEFEAAGYEIPETWDELMELTDFIAADGDTAWCIGIESGTATGWPATDWLEEIMLRTTSLENYDRWVAGELPFASPEVTNAAEIMGEIWLNDDYVNGGRASIITTFFGDAPLPMFEEPPKCWLHKQGNFITSFFPSGAEAGTDYDFFYLPPIDEEYGKPVLVAGDIMAMFDDRPEVRAVMEFFTLGRGVEGWVKSGGAISPHYDSNLDWYTNDVDRGVAGIILNADSVRFDASDLMPGEVGAGSFWKGMTDWISGSVELQTALEEIDTAWPE